MSARTIEKLRETFPDFFLWSETKRGVLPLTSNSDLASAQLDEESHEIPIFELTNEERTSADDGQGVMRLPKSFLEMLTSAPAEYLAFAHGVGDSMTPTLGERDLLLLDKSQDVIRANDQIWCLSSDGVAMVKRVRIECKSKAILISDNSAVPNQHINLERFKLVGRVIAIVKIA
ncbi:MAG: S24 family peptidase [Erythrobacter sp.]|uniref:S24 family peptidase n=1 Tax=Erythrobacter sp. TaxID=1042 RepID=UPI003297D432